MHKLSAVILAAYVVAVERARKALNAGSVALHALLVQWHLNNLRALVQQAEGRVQRLLDLKHYHHAQAYEAAALVADAEVHVAFVHEQAKQEAERHGASLPQA
ncbi:hypothetical protein MAFF241648_14500 [Ralstonia solanacearum]|nr:hypothetical protein MAFF241648_14500 [Ralstonia solanacearum]